MILQAFMCPGCKWRPFSLAALVVRFLTRRFIGDYERNAGKSPDSTKNEDQKKQKKKKLEQRSWDVGV